MVRRLYKQAQLNSNADSITPTQLDNIQKLNELLMFL